MKNFCYELGKLIVDSVGENVRFANNVESVNDLRRALANLRGVDPDTANKSMLLLEELERNYKGKALFKQIDDVKRNLAGVLTLLLKIKGKEIPPEELEA